MTFPPNNNNLKKLEGVNATDALLSLHDECLTLCKDYKPLLETASTDSSLNYSPPRNATGGGGGADATPPVSPMRHVMMSRSRPFSFEEARTILMDFETQQRPRKNKTQQGRIILPIAIIRAMKVIFRHDQNDNNSNKAAQLEDALGQTQLAFTAPPPNHNNSNMDAPSPTKTHKKFQARMERLRLQNEESKYFKLTKNIGNRPKQDDDITTKSMTYAASIGLNMIVAPVSFGVFMFFFSGPILNFVWRNFTPPSHPGAVDVRQVIIGVISGVGMLFVEMLLFVIRTHELDRAMRLKQTKKGGKSSSAIKPFGDYSATSSKTYVDSDTTSMSTTGGATASTSSTKTVLTMTTTTTITQSQKTD